VDIFNTGQRALADLSDTTTASLLQEPGQAFNRGHAHDGVHAVHCGTLPSRTRHNLLLSSMKHGAETATGVLPQQQQHRCADVRLACIPDSADGTVGVIGLHSTISGR
jgi:hypothetical protein